MCTDFPHLSPLKILCLQPSFSSPLLALSLNSVWLLINDLLHSQAGKPALAVTDWAKQQADVDMSTSPLRGSSCQAQVNAWSRLLAQSQMSSSYAAQHQEIKYVLAWECSVTARGKSYPAETKDVLCHSCSVLKHGDSMNLWRVCCSGRSLWSV